MNPWLQLQRLAVILFKFGPFEVIGAGFRIPLSDGRKRLLIASTANRNMGTMQGLSDFFSFLVLIKMATAVLMVIALSVIAEVVSPRIAGILSGYPLGSAISLFFIGYEIGPQFAADSALYTSLGLIATQVFAYCYYRSSLLTEKWSTAPQILCSSLGGIGGYFLAAVFLRPLRVNPVFAVLLPTLFIFLFIRLFRGVQNRKIQKRAGINLNLLLIRAVFAACAIVVITSLAKLIGPAWAGLFSAFPITMLPLVAIIHFTYHPEHVHSILKNVPTGLGSLVVYTLAVFFFYPMYGIYMGTALSYGLATLYLIATQLKVSLPLGSFR